VAQLSQTDELSWDTQVEVLPEGFKVVQLEHGIDIHCISRSIPWTPKAALVGSSLPLSRS
jgi:hypothetical protein